MKTLFPFIIIFWVLNVSIGWSQPKFDKKSAEQNAEKTAERLGSALELNAEQKEKVKDISLKTTEAIHTLKKKYYEQFDDDLKKLEEQTEDLYKAVLTDKQFSKFKKLKKRRKREFRRAHKKDD